MYFSLDISENKTLHILETIDKLLNKYDIDSTICSQRIMCTLLNDASENVSNGNGTSIDKILDGLSR